MKDPPFALPRVTAAGIGSLFLKSPVCFLNLNGTSLRSDRSFQNPSFCRRRFGIKALDHVAGVVPLKLPPVFLFVVCRVNLGRFAMSPHL